MNVETKTYQGSPHACSGTGWCRLLSVWLRMDTHSSPVALTHDDSVGPATAIHGSRWREADPCDVTPSIRLTRTLYNRNCSFGIRRKTQSLQKCRSNELSSFSQNDEYIGKTTGIEGILCAHFIHFANAVVTTDSSYLTALSSASWSTIAAVSLQILLTSTTWFMVCCWPQPHVDDLTRPHLCRFARHAPWPVQKRLSTDHVRRVRLHTGCRTVGSVTTVQMTTEADAQLCQQVLCLTTLGTEKRAEEVYFQIHQNTRASLCVYRISSISSDNTNNYYFRCPK